jgi:hypothetical protein
LPNRLGLLDEQGRIGPSGALVYRIHGGSVLYEEEEKQIPLSISQTHLLGNSLIPRYKDSAVSRRPDK